MVPKQGQVDSQDLIEGNTHAQVKFAIVSTVPEDVGAQTVVADTNIAASSVGRLDMERKAALSRLDVIYGMQPTYLRHNFWEEGKNNKTNLHCVADWMEHAKPLQDVPMGEFTNTVAMRMIEEHPNLFKIVTPINIDRFEELLQTHLNHPFVEAVCCGVHEGFWPWADTRQSELPSIVDESLDMLKKVEEVEFL
jgi:hypothetical protein